jgi:hypothetical protein
VDEIRDGGKRWREIALAAEDALAAERAKGAGLRETVDNVRALAESWATHSTNAVSAVLLGQSAVIRSAGRAVLALLPAVSEGAPTVGTDGQTAWETAFANHYRTTPPPTNTFNVPAAVVQPTGTAGECGHVAHEHRDGVRFGYYGTRAAYAPEPCPSQSAKGEQ